MHVIIQTMRAFCNLPIYRGARNLSYLFILNRAWGKRVRLRGLTERRKCNFDQIRKKENENNVGPQMYVCIFYVANAEVGWSLWIEATALHSSFTVCVCVFFAYFQHCGVPTALFNSHSPPFILIFTHIYFDTIVL